MTRPRCPDCAQLARLEHGLVILEIGEEPGIDQAEPWFGGCDPCGVIICEAEELPD